MKLKRIFGMGLLVFLCASVSALGQGYRVTSDFPEVNGIYSYWGDIITEKFDGIYSDDPMPVYQLTGQNYYIGYRGCGAKWVIIQLNSAPTPDLIGGGPGYGLLIRHMTDSATPPRTGWIGGSHVPDYDDVFALEVIPTYDLTINTAGNGTVSQAPGTSPYDENTIVSLTASPATGYSFSGWSGDHISTDNPASITMDADKNVTATFIQLAAYNLTTNTVGSGSVTLVPPGGTYYDMTTVTVTAEPSTYWTFSAWSGDLSGSASPTTITMDDHKSITATFTEMADYNLSVSAIGSGAVILDPPGGTYYIGTIVSITATPQNAYWTFNGWSGDLSSSVNPATITMDADKNVTATFIEMGRYDLNINTAGSGSVTIDPVGGSYYDGTNVTVTAVPEDAYWQFTGWSGDLSGAISPTSITMDSGKTINATFTLIDTDGDGISDRDEDAGTNGGDGNYDGTLDRIQSHVACLQMHNQTQMVTLESAAGTTLSNCVASGNPHPDDYPDWVGFPYGFFQFSITGLAPGGATTLTLHLPDVHGLDIPNTYYKYGPLPSDPTPQWYRFKYENSLQVGAQFNGRTVTLNLIDGAMGDDDLTANGTIQDAGGPGVLNNGTGNTPNGPTPTNGGGGGGGGGCYLQTIRP